MTAFQKFCFRAILHDYKDFLSGAKDIPEKCYTDFLATTYVADMLEKGDDSVYTFLQVEYSDNYDISLRNSTRKERHMAYLATVLGDPTEDTRKNPALHIWHEWSKEALFYGHSDTDVLFSVHGQVAYDLRNLCLSKLTYAIPTNSVLKKMIDCSPGGIFEVGSGSGYWAHKLSQLGADIVAIDNFSGIYACSKVFKATHMDASTVKPEQYGKRSLLLVWPHAENQISEIPLAKTVLDNYPGNTILFVGEDGGATFHIGQWAEENNWNLALDMPLPSWPGVYDSFRIYHRKP